MPSMAGRAVRRHYEDLLTDPRLDRGGVRIRSAINANIQLLVEAELKHLGDAVDPALEVAAVCVDPRNGAIRAIVGGRPSSSRSRFNRAFDARRDLGSAFTPFLLAAAAERGYPLDLENIVSTGRRVGGAETIRLVTRLGFTGPFDPGDDLFRGTIAATPLELATAVASLCNEGQRPDTFLLQEIVSPRGEFLFTHHPRLVPALSPQAVSESLELHFPAGTTPTLAGLSPGRTDGWAMFFSPRFAIVIWIGYDQPAPLRDPDAIRAQLATAINRLARELTPAR
jgi:penicillin-binding protein 1A